MTPAIVALQNSGLSFNELMMRWKFGVVFFKCAGTCSLSPFSSSSVRFDGRNGELMIEGRFGRCGRHDGRW